jgi:hypothetical protein
MANLPRIYLIHNNPLFYLKCTHPVFAPGVSRLMANLPRIYLIRINPLFYLKRSFRGAHRLPHPI